MIEFTVSSLGLQPCPLHTETTEDSLNLLMILWTVEGEIGKYDNMTNMSNIIYF